MHACINTYILIDYVSLPWLVPMEPVLDALLQFLDLIQNLAFQIRPILMMIRSNRALKEAFYSAKALYDQLPETVSLSLTVAVVFISSLLVLRLGRSLVSLVVFCLQVAVMLIAGFVIWRMRDSLTDFFEYLLNQ
jgi:hypothetical protein